MSNWNRLLAALDKAIGFPNRAGSTVKKVRQIYDEKSNEHVFLLEYRVRVIPGFKSPKKHEAMKMLRDLMAG